MQGNGMTLLVICLHNKKKGKLHEYWQGRNFERNVDQGVSCLRRSLYGKLILRKIVK